MTEVRPGQLYRHYKGDLYRVEQLVLREEDRAILVVYHRVAPPGGDPGPTWARPLSHWGDWVEKGVRRYELLEE